MTEATKRPRRPTKWDDSRRVDLRLSASDYERAAAKAKARGLSVGRWAAEVVARAARKV